MSGKPAARLSDPTYCPIAAKFSLTVFITDSSTSSPL